MAVTLQWRVQTALHVVDISVALFPDENVNTLANRDKCQFGTWHGVVSNLTIPNIKKY
jgi:hypothetical protein